jgi:Phage integrase family
VPLSDDAIAVLQGCLGQHPTHVFTYAKIGKGGKILWRRPMTSGSNNTGFRKARKRAGLLGLRWHDLRHTWATWHAQAGTPAIVLQALGGWKDARMVRTYTHLAAVDLLDHANAIRLPSAPLSAGTNSSTVEMADDGEDEQVLDVIGVDDGIRTHNNRNHNPRSLPSTGAGFRAIVGISLANST